MNITVFKPRVKGTREIPIVQVRQFPTGKTVSPPFSAPVPQGGYRISCGKLPHLHYWYLRRPLYPGLHGKNMFPRTPYSFPREEVVVAAFILIIQGGTCRDIKLWYRDACHVYTINY